MLDKLFGIHADALQLKSRRMQVLSNNIANADTPGFKAKMSTSGQHWVGNLVSNDSERHMTSTGKALATQTTAKFSRFLITLLSTGIPLK